MSEEESLIGGLLLFLVCRGVGGKPLHAGSPGFSSAEGEVKLDDFGQPCCLDLSGEIPGGEEPLTLLFPSLATGWACSGEAKGRRGE